MTLGSVPGPDGRDAGCGVGSGCVSGCGRGDGFGVGVGFGSGEFGAIGASRFHRNTQREAAGQKARVLSSRSVTGPWLTRRTSIMAPKTPSLTSSPPAATRVTK